VNKQNERALAFTFGVVFVVALIALALFVPHPTAFQYTVFRIVLSLAAAGVAITFTGFLQVTLSAWIKAGGALAVFVLVFFYNPVSLVEFKEKAPVAPGNPIAAAMEKLAEQDPASRRVGIQELEAIGESEQSRDRVMQVLSSFVRDHAGGLYLLLATYHELLSFVKSVLAGGFDETKEERRFNGSVPKGDLLQFASDRGDV
jgi:hypothetical protein